MTATLSRALLLWLALAPAQTARADDATPAPSRCEALVDRAREHHAAERYREALAVSREAYACDPQPGLLFAMGQMSFNLAAYRAAEAYYVRFLATKPDADATALALQALAVTRERISAEASRIPPPPPPRADKLAWGFAIGGGAAVLTSAALYVAARQQIVDTSGGFADYADRVDRAHKLRVASIAIGGAGVALAVVAAIRWTSRSDAAPHASVSRRAAIVPLLPTTGDIVGIAITGDL